MADDAGTRAPAAKSEPKGTLAGSGFELKVTDPIDGGDAGYVYLFQRAPGSRLGQGAGHDYVTYDFVLKNGPYKDYVFESPYDPVRPPKPNVNPENSTVKTSLYSTHFKDRWLNDQLSITAGDSSGVDILDADKIWYFPGNCGRTEGSFAAGHGAFVSNIDGPVRAIRDYIGANSGQYTERRQVFYRGRQDVTTFLRVHPADDTPDDLHDYSAAAKGMTYRNNLNRNGVKINGVPDTVKLGELQWEQVSGGPGSYTIVHRSELTQPDLVPTSFYADDATPDFEQCTGDKEAIGTSGPAVAQPMENTDPRPEFVERYGALFDITTYRTQYYDGPNQGPADAEQRNAWVRSPLQASYQPYSR